MQLLRYLPNQRVGIPALIHHDDSPHYLPLSVQLGDATRQYGA